MSNLQLPAADLKPVKLGQYLIEETIGEGSMGIVYKGCDPVMDRQVALKAVHNIMLRHDDHGHWSARLRREAQAAARCRHENVVQVYECGEDRIIGTAFIVMEYVRGDCLKTYLDKQVKFSADSIVFIISQVLNGLACAHRNGVVHRDIKPGNIMILNDGNVKITDFGVAQIDGGTPGRGQNNEIAGTPKYMAPEQCLSQQINHLSDIYAAGVLMYELLTGVPAFSGNSANAIMQQVLHKKPDWRPLHGRPVPGAFRPLLAKALAKNPRRRFRSADDFRNALQWLGKNKDRYELNQSTTRRAFSLHRLWQGWHGHLSCYCQ